MESVTETITDKFSPVVIRPILFIFFELAVLYLAEAVITILSPRNHILLLFLIWRRHFLGMASLHNLSCVLPFSFKVPESQIQSSAAAAAKS